MINGRRIYHFSNVLHSCLIHEIGAKTFSSSFVPQELYEKKKKTADNFHPESIGFIELKQNISFKHLMGICYNNKCFIESFSFLFYSSDSVAYSVA